MRYDAMELGLGRTTARRRGAKRKMRTFLAARKPAGAAEGGAATIAIDEAFAGLSSAEVGANNLPVVRQLVEQLQALDRQREQLDQLLRDIKLNDLAE